MLFALGWPVLFAGLLLAFLAALVLRAVAIRFTARTLGLTDRHDTVTPRLREDVDPFGAVAAAVAGAGWGRTIDVDEVPRFRGRGRAAAVFAAGPVTVLLASQLALAAYRFTITDTYELQYGSLGAAVRGQFEGGSTGAGFLLAFASGLLAFGLLALIPMPPLDGFGLLWSAARQPGPGLQGYRLWFDHKNIGVVVLVVCAFFPLGAPLLLIPLDLIGTVFLRLWSA